jgi:PIN domain nuclease of toxin-antitoxin system
MRLLLDTHALVWWWTDDPRLPAPARAVIADPDNTVLVSAATAWELATKHRLGKWPEVERIIADLDGALRRCPMHRPLARWRGHIVIPSIAC